MKEVFAKYVESHTFRIRTDRNFIVFHFVHHYAVCSRNLLTGKNLFGAGKYEEAQGSFQEAAKTCHDSAAFTYLAATAYKRGQFENARALIEQAEKSPPDTLSYLRMYGYKAFILLSLDSRLGMEALDDYIKRYEYDYPLTSIDEVKAMRRSGIIDRARLEALIEEQVSWYEKEMELYIYNRVGFYARDSKYAR
jgi:tetratricopeptide (TPR) repeat protein